MNKWFDVYLGKVMKRRVHKTQTESFLINVKTLINKTTHLIQILTLLLFSGQENIVYNVNLKCKHKLLKVYNKSIWNKMNPVFLS